VAVGVGELFRGVSVGRVVTNSVGTPLGDDVGVIGVAEQPVRNIKRRVTPLKKVERGRMQISLYIFLEFDYLISEQYLDGILGALI
jgi:hypothetical protein